MFILSFFTFLLSLTLIPPLRIFQEFFKISGPLTKLLMFSYEGRNRQTDKQAGNTNTSFQQFNKIQKQEGEREAHILNTLCELNLYFIGEVSLQVLSRIKPGTDNSHNLMTQYQILKCLFYTNLFKFNLRKKPEKAQLFFFIVLKKNSHLEFHPLIEAKVF